jgi:hypothetical protein
VKERTPDPTYDSLRKSPTYAEELGIDLRRRDDREIFKWFLASALFGARISETIAARTYRAFERHDRLTPEGILDAGWDFLVNPIMKEGGYVRYDEKTSREILRNCEQLISQYRGSLGRLHHAATSPRDLETRVLAFYGVGPVTVNIFLRELRPYWRKADPAPLPVVAELARIHGIDLDTLDRKSLSFVRMEAGLIRLRKTLKA